MERKIYAWLLGWKEKNSESCALMKSGQFVWTYLGNAGSEVPAL